MRERIQDRAYLSGAQIHARETGSLRDLMIVEITAGRAMYGIEMTADGARELAAMLVRMAGRLDAVREEVA